jgi:enoyl-[acyl-carrier protein] reductase I
MSKSYGLLEGKKGIIFGALVESSLAWAIAERVYEEGGRFVLSNAPVARRLGSLEKLSEATESPSSGLMLPTTTTSPACSKR